MATINLGRVKPVFQGAYSGATAYVVDDIVTHDGNSYICILASTGNAPTNATYWHKMAAGSDLGGLSGLTAGDIAVYNGTSWVRQAIGSAGEALKVNSGGTGVEYGQAGAVKEIFYDNPQVANTSTGSYFFTFNFTPNFSGNIIYAYRLTYRMTSATYMYVTSDLSVNAGSSYNTDITYDGFGYPPSSSSHNQSGSAIVRAPDACTAGTQCTIRVKNNGGGTAGSAGDGDSEASIVVWII